MSTNALPPLLSCPFCGSDGKIDTVNPSDSVYRAECQNALCLTTSCSTYWHKTEAAAIAAWNTRTPDPQTVKVLEDIVGLFEIDESIAHAARKMKVLATAELARLKGESNG